MGVALRDSGIAAVTAPPSARPLKLLPDAPSRRDPYADVWDAYAEMIHEDFGHTTKLGGSDTLYQSALTPKTPTNHSSLHTSPRTIVRRG